VYVPAREHEGLIHAQIQAAVVGKADAVAVRSQRIGVGRGLLYETRPGHTAAIAPLRAEIHRWFDAISAKYVQGVPLVKLAGPLQILRLVVIARAQIAVRQPPRETVR